MAPAPRGSATNTSVQPLGVAPAARQARTAASGSTCPLVTVCTKVTADGTATANFVGKFTSACVIHHSAIFGSGGKAGIGNSSLGGILDVSGTTVVWGTLNLSQTTSSSVGVISLGGSPFVHASCSVLGIKHVRGRQRRNFKTTGVGHNTASGFKALFSNSTGSGNTADGYFAPSSNTNGSKDRATHGTGQQVNSRAGRSKVSLTMDRRRRRSWPAWFAPRVPFCSMWPHRRSVHHQPPRPGYDGLQDPVTERSQTLYLKRGLASTGTPPRHPTLQALRETSGSVTA